MKRYSSLLLRVSMSLVFLWFGSQQVTGPSDWTGFLPDWTSMLPISSVAIVSLNGWFEIVFGLLLLSGTFTRFVSLLLGLHLVGIALTMGFNAVGVRDFGLALATLSVFLNGADEFTFDLLLFGGSPRTEEIVT